MYKFNKQTSTICSDCLTADGLTVKKKKIALALALALAHDCTTQDRGLQCKSGCSGCSGECVYV
jgi:hypothetical protein